jgi:hypothetical protein
MGTSEAQKSNPLPSILPAAPAWADAQATYRAAEGELLRSRDGGTTSRYEPEGGRVIAVRETGCTRSWPTKSVALSLRTIRWMPDPIRTEDW